jgi:hypothetical protein
MIGADKGAPAWYALLMETSFLFIDVFLVAFLTLLSALVSKEWFYSE